MDIYVAVARIIASFAPSCVPHIIEGMDMNNMHSRRHFLRGSGSLLIGFSILKPVFADAPASNGLIGDLKTYPELSSWLKLDMHGYVHLFVGKVELGQGILTAITQCCADELDVDVARITITSGDTFLVNDEGVTAGSQSMSYGASAVRQASAEARAYLLNRAAQKWAVDVRQLHVKDGTIFGPTHQRINYWDLLDGQIINITATGKVALKQHKDRRYIGKKIPRVDLPSKVFGQQIFIQDLRPQGMVHGRILRPPAYNASLTSLDTSAAEKMAGVLKIVRNGSFVGVIAAREEQAIAAVDVLRQNSKWNVPHDGPNQDTIFEWLKAQKTKDLFIKDSLTKNPPPIADVVEATFHRPFHMHASIGPSTAIATLGADGVMTIQTHSQSVFETSAAIAEMLGVDLKKVRCQHVQGSGCYGHNGADDVAADAALLAREFPERPVRIQWSRNDEHKWEPYGSAMIMHTKASLDAKGDIIDWTYELWSTSHGTRPGKKAGNLLPAWSLEKPFALPTPINNGGPNFAADRNAIPYYDFGQKVTTHFIENFAIRASSTRGLGAYANIFATESFMDELAIRAKVDPLAYRLRTLKDERARAVLLKATDHFGWSHYKPQKGHGRGLAFARYKNISTYLGIAMEVAVDEASGQVRVLRISAAADAGEIVSHDGTLNQIEGGIIQSLSWTLKEAVRFDPTGIKSEDWTAYPILTFSEIPPIHIDLIDRQGEPFLGAGEASQGPTGAALANAVRDATGVRFYEMPFIPSRIKQGLAQKQK
jgi:CO/xanthine dehydrogenase Mo-binding subunit